MLNKTAGMKARVRHNGFIMIELILAMSLITTMMVWYIQDKVAEQMNTGAQVFGSQINTYAAAAMRHIVDRPTDFPVGTTNEPNDAWLKTAACDTGSGGSAVKDYLPCTFDSTQMTFMLGSPAVTVVKNALGVITVTMNFPSINVNGTVRRDLANLAITKAKTLDSASQTSLGYSSVTINEVDTTGAIQVSITTDQTLSPWLLRSGGTMTGDINAGGNNISNISNVSTNNLNASGTTVLTGVTTINGDLGVTGNGAFKDVQLTGVVDSGGAQPWMSGAPTWGGVYMDGNTVTKPQCPHGSPFIYLSPVAVSDDLNGEPIGAMQVYTDDLVGSWRVHVRIYNSTGWVGGDSVPSAYRRVNAFTKCG